MPARSAASARLRPARCRCSMTRRPRSLTVWLADIGHPHFWADRCGSGRIDVVVDPDRDVLTRVLGGRIRQADTDLQDAMAVDRHDATVVSIRRQCEAPGEPAVLEF